MFSYTLFCLVPTAFISDALSELLERELLHVQHSTRTAYIAPYLSLAYLAYLSTLSWGRLASKSCGTVIIFKTAKYQRSPNPSKVSSTKTKMVIPVEYGHFLTMGMKLIVLARSVSLYSVQMLKDRIKKDSISIGPSNSYFFYSIAENKVKSIVRMVHHFTSHHLHNNGSIAMT